ASLPMHSLLLFPEILFRTVQALPELALILCRTNHWVTFLAGKGFLELGHILQSPVRPEFSQRVWICIQQQSLRFRTLISRPHSGKCQEKPLIPCIAIQDRSLLPLKS